MVEGTLLPMAEHNKDQAGVVCPFLQPRHVEGRANTQRLRHPVIKEYTLKYNRNLHKT